MKKNDGMNRGFVATCALPVFLVLLLESGLSSANEISVSRYSSSVCLSVKKELLATLRAVPYSWQAVCVALYMSPALRAAKDEVCGKFPLCAFEQKRD